MENTGSMMSQEKLLAQGASSPTDVGLLALFLRIGMRSKNMLTLTREMLQHFEPLHGLLSTDYMDFSYVQRIDIAKYAQLRGITGLARRYYKVRMIEERALLNPEMVREFLRNRLSQGECEISLVIFMDSQHRVTKHSKLFPDTFSHVEVHPREIVREAVKMNTSAVILTHNHPSGCAEPSKANRLITERVVKCYQFMDIQVLDHLVIGRGEYVSFAERGWA